MIVYLEIPPLAGRYRSLAALTPPGAAGWLGDGDVAGCRLVGTDLPLCEAVPLLPRARLWTFILHDPVSAAAQRWSAAQDDAADPAHVVANTFNVAEAAILGLPETAAGALMRHLSADGGPAEPDAVIAHLDTLPMLIGFVQNPHAYAAAVDQLLGLPPQSVDPFALAPKIVPLPKPVREELQRRMAGDLALQASLLALRGERRLYRTPPARPVDAR